MDFMFVQSPKEKNRLNFYLNDNNLYVKNSLKMRQKHLSHFNDSIKIKKELKKKYPIPKILYSTSDINFHNYKKKLIQDYSPKNAIKDLMDVVNNFTDNLTFDDDEDEEKTEKKKEIIDDDENNKKDREKDSKKNTIKNSSTSYQKIKKKRPDDFFLTNKYMFNNKKNIRNNAKQEILNDLQFAKSKNTKEAITSQKEINKINNKKKIFKNNLYFENYGKFKFTTSGLFYPKKMGKYELPNYTGSNEEEKKYFNYRKKIFRPELTYNKISNFSEKLNRDLGEVNNNYKNNMSRTRFTENPLMKKYMEVIPVYEIYKDLKQIENRYIGSKYKFKLLPLYNKRLSNIDKLADRFYKEQNLKTGLASLLNIQSASYDNKNKKNK